MQYLTVICLLCLASHTSAQIILTEVMFDPLGSEGTDEFIEIYNAGDRPVDLSGYLIGDQDAQEILVAPNGTLLLQPAQFAVIFDLDYYETSNAYQAIVPMNALQLAVDDRTIGSGGLLNSRAETIVLLDGDGKTIAIYTYSPGNPSGISDEKIILNADDSSENWRDSSQQNGTPGAQNSVSPRSFDLAIEPEHLSWQPQKPTRGEIVNISFSIRNLGLEAIHLSGLQIYIDSNSDSLFSENEHVATLDIDEQLAVQTGRHIIWQWQSQSSGRHFFKACLLAEQDARPTNDSLFFQIPVGFLANDLVLNEIMAAPASGGSEWIELLNISSIPIHLQGWYIADASSTSQPIAEPIIVESGAFILLSADEMITQTGEKFVKINGWPALNNDEDSIVLFDFNGTIIDRFDYQVPTGTISGTSLERINPRLPASESGNWGSSVAVSGATPGARNSIFTEIVPIQSALAAHPNPFSPDADGFDDVTVISYKLPLLQSQVNLSIYDLRGRRVRQLLNNAPSGASRDVVWDGKTDDGRVLPIGIYVVHLQAIDAANGKIERTNTTVILAQKL